MAGYCHHCYGGGLASSHALLRNDRKGSDHGWLPSLVICVAFSLQGMSARHVGLKFVTAALTMLGRNASRARKDQVTPM